MKEEIIQPFQEKIRSLNKNDPCYNTRKEYYENKMEEELDAVDSFEKSKNKRKRKFQNIDEKIEDCLDPTKTKMIIEFNNRESASIKSFAVKERGNIKVTSWFLSGKLLMFAKLSLKSFNYELVETFCFLKENVKKYDKYNIEKVNIYHILTDTDSTSLKFVFVSDPNNDIPESKYRHII